MLMVMSNNVVFFGVAYLGFLLSCINGVLVHVLVNVTGLSHKTTTQAGVRELVSSKPQG